MGLFRFIRNARRYSKAEKEYLNRLDLIQFVEFSHEHIDIMKEMRKYQTDTPDDKEIFK